MNNWVFVFCNKHCNITRINIIIVIHTYMQYQTPNKRQWSSRTRKKCNTECPKLAVSDQKNTCPNTSFIWGGSSISMLNFSMRTNMNIKLVRLDQTSWWLIIIVSLKIAEFVDFWTNRCHISGYKPWYVRIVVGLYPSTSQVYHPILWLCMSKNQPTHVIVLIKLMFHHIQLITSHDIPIISSIYPHYRCHNRM